MADEKSGSIGESLHVDEMVPAANGGVSFESHLKILAFCLDCARDPMLLLCPEGRILFGNTGAAQLLGRNRSELADAFLFYFIPALEEAWPDGFNLSTLGEAGRRWQVRDPSGSGRVLHWNAVGFDVDARQYTLLTMNEAERDLTADQETAVLQISTANERLFESNRQLEKSIFLAEKLADDVHMAGRAKTAFLSNLSYEIRTPMNVIVGMLSLLKDTPMDEEQVDYIKTAESAAGHLMAVISDIVDLSQIENRQLDFDKIVFSLPDAVDRALDGYAVRAQEKGVELTCVIERDVPISLIGDPRRLQRLLENFLENSVSVTERGEVNLEISLDRRTDETAEIRFLVADTGPGLSPEVIEVLTRSPNEKDLDARSPALGFGMTLARQIAALMNAEIAAVNDDRGSAVWFTAEFVIAKDALSEIPSDDNFSDCEVIVADDNMSARRAVALCAMSLGCRVKETSTATELATRIHLSKARLSEKVTVFVDVEMPAVAHALKPNGLLPPFVTLIGMVPRMGFREGQGFLREDFTAFMTKPIKHTRLIRTLARVLRSVGESEREETRQTPETGMSMITAPLRVLVVEDNENNQKVALNILRRIGCSVTIAINGKEGVVKLSEEDFDLVFMDIQMPVMDGREATKMIRSGEAGVRNKDIPIIAMTAHAFEDDRAECLAAGMNDYLAKPVETEHIRVSIEKNLKLKFSR